MQKMAASYVIKQIGDQLFAQPAQPVQQDEPAVELSEPADDFDGQLFLDENEQPLGRLTRLHDVAVYVATDGRGDAEHALEWCLGESESRIFVRREAGHVTGLIYAPGPSYAPPRVEGTRADEV